MNNNVKKIKIVSGGQTGADRAALDAAKAMQISHGGWCPHGRIAEDGKLSMKYRLRQTPHSDYVERTLWNVRDSDATLIFTTKKKLSGGTLMTWRFAKQLKKPVLHICSQDLQNPLRKLDAFIKNNGVKLLNVAGPRASKEPRVYEFVYNTLCSYLEK